MRQFGVIFFVITAFLALTVAIVLQGRGQVDPPAPLSSVVAITHPEGKNIAEFVKAQVAQASQVSNAASGKAPARSFPLAPATSDTIRVLDGLHSHVVVKWLDPLTTHTSASVARFGANNDYLAYFGDDWDADWQGDVPGSAPQFNGSGQSGWLWVNHEYVSNFPPTLTTAPTGQHLTLAKFLKAQGILQNNVEAPLWPQAALDTYIRHHKQQLGGSWLRVVRNPQTGRWSVDRSAQAVRFTATSQTLVTVTGQTLRSRDHDDTGKPLAAGVVVGILADCSGGQTPWGTIITAEENQQWFYGDLEICWDQNQKFITEKGCAPGALMAMPTEPSPASLFGQTSHWQERHSREGYGYLVEIDIRSAPNIFYTSVAEGGSGQGHRKIGSMGRARWENVAIVVDQNWQLQSGKRIVFYAGNDRHSGRIYKWVSKEAYSAGMTRARIRSLLDQGTLFVAHFAGLDNATGKTLLGGTVPTEQQPGFGQWIHLSIDSPDIAPNAKALGDAKKTVGAALQDVDWNNMGGFQTDDDVRRTLFTAAAKVGVMELNRPEDLEWNPKDLSGTPRLYVAFTNHVQGTQLDQHGVVLDRSIVTVRNDKDGAIFAIQEADAQSPAQSKTFSYFSVWQGSVDPADASAAANPDNLMIDREGGVWFGTDGNFIRTKGRAADALYYLDLDPGHQAGKPGITAPGFGRAFRIAAVPSDAEATGPAFNSDMTTIFLSVQHPGERFPSTWPPVR